MKQDIDKKLRNVPFKNNLIRFMSLKFNFKR